MTSIPRADMSVVQYSDVKKYGETISVDRVARYQQVSEPVPVTHFLGTSDVIVTAYVDGQVIPTLVQIIDRDSVSLRFGFFDLAANGMLAWRHYPVLHDVRVVIVG